MIEGVINTPTEVDLSVLSKFDDLEEKIGINTTYKKMMQFLKILIKQYGGKWTQEDLEGLEAYVLETKNRVLGQYDNISFLDKKVQSLNLRMNNVVKSNEKLFEIRAKVEFLVNKLEQVKDKSEDYDLILDRIQQMMKDINDQTRSNKKDEELAEYVGNLESYVTKLEAYVESIEKQMITEVNIFRRTESCRTKL